jgi:hypothetical protein
MNHLTAALARIATLVVGAWVFDRILKSITGALEQTTAVALRETPAAPVPQLPLDSEQLAMFATFMEQGVARELRGESGADPTDLQIPDFDGGRPEGGRVASVPAGTFAATNGNLVEAFKRGEFATPAQGFMRPDLTGEAL